MGEFLEVHTRSGSTLVALESERVTIGKHPDNVVALDDPRVSRIHAAIEPYGPGWCVRDLTSRNGTFVNGEQVTGDRALRPGDEIRVGDARLIFRADAPAALPETQGAEAVPYLTRREREVLVGLCRPVLQGTILTGPATVREIATELVVTESAVKKHLVALYDKFGVLEGDRRMGRLAAEALRRGAVSRADLGSGT